MLFHSAKQYDSDYLTLTITYANLQSSSVLFMFVSGTTRLGRRNAMRKGEFSPHFPLGQKGQPLTGNVKQNLYFDEIKRFNTG